MSEATKQDKEKLQRKKNMKNIRKNQEKNLRNRIYKTILKNLKKKLFKSIEENQSKEEIKNNFSLFQKKTHCAATKKVLHKNTASRIISRTRKAINKHI